MSPTPAPIRPASLSGTDSDRRSHPRYTIILDLEYKLLNRGQLVQFGAGRTVNFSTGGVLFETNDVLLSSGPIELTLNWPFLLDGVCRLKLVIQGRVVRNDGNRIAVSIEHHQFHTAGTRSQSA